MDTFTVAPDPFRNNEEKEQTKKRESSVATTEFYFFSLQPNTENIKISKELRLSTLSPSNIDLHSLLFADFFFLLALVFILARWRCHCRYQSIVFFSWKDFLRFHMSKDVFHANGSSKHNENVADKTRDR